MTVLPSFDPRVVPVTFTDSHLAKVDPRHLTPHALERRFASGHSWVPELSAESQFVDRQPVNASVLIPLVMRDQLNVILTQRTTHLSSHSGQIAFPGGKADAGDASATATALRETLEEVGIGSEFVKVLGVLPTYTTGSAFAVTPVLGLLTEGFEIRPNPHEVADVFEVPLDFLMDPSNHHHHVFEWAGKPRRWISMPYRDGDQERYIWGATAGMIRNLYRYLLD